jgi:putative hydrolase of the HAD superfamily
VLFRSLPAGAAAVADLVQCYRHHVPVLRLYPDAGRVLDALRPGYRLAVVTDGLPVMQRAKLAALGLPERLDSYACCWEHDAPKPDPYAYRIVLAALGATPAEALVVGDRPDHDMAAAQALGCRSVRIRRGRFAQAPTGGYAAEHEIDSLDALPGLLPRRENATWTRPAH